MRDRLELEGEINWKCFRQIQQELVAAIEDEGVKLLELDLSAVTRVYPNGAVPLIILLDHYRQSFGAGFRLLNTQHLRPLYSHDYLAYLDPESGVKAVGGATAVHSFEGDHELNDLINRKLDQVLAQAQFAPGVLTAFEWFLNEMAGNVLVHSEAAKGWLQVVVHPQTHHIAVVVADGGLGIPRTIRESESLKEKYAGVSDGEAIEIALREGITSKPDYGQGKGLTGTISIVKANKGGRFAITSCGGRVFYSPDSIGLKVNSNQPPFPGTVVDVQLDSSEPIEIEKALWGHVPVSFTETVYGKDRPVGVMRLLMKDQARSFGNRITASRIRLKIENLLNEAPADALEIDFEEVTMIASSFADEVFGKLATRLGIIGFSRKLKFVNLNAFCQGIIDDVVQARIAQTYVNRNVGK